MQLTNRVHCKALSTVKGDFCMGCYCAVLGFIFKYHTNELIKLISIPVAGLNCTQLLQLTTLCTHFCVSLQVVGFFSAWQHHQQRVTMDQREQCAQVTPMCGKHWIDQPITRTTKEPFEPSSAQLHSWITLFLANEKIQMH